MVICLNFLSNILIKNSYKNSNYITMNRLSSRKEKKEKSTNRFSKYKNSMAINIKIEKH